MNMLDRRVPGINWGHSLIRMVMVIRHEVGFSVPVIRLADRVAMGFPSRQAGQQNAQDGAQPKRPHQRVL